MHSTMAQKLASEIRDAMVRESALFDFPYGDSPPILLVLDRKADLITPLLLQWTYQAMVHDLFGIRNGRVSLAANLYDAEEGTASHGLEEKEGAQHKGSDYVLSIESDSFYRDNVDSTFGDLGENVRRLVQDFQERTLQHQSQLDSIPSMKRFIEEYPEYQQMSTYVSKHVSLVGEISKRVERMHLLEISELEQRISKEEASSVLLGQVQSFLERVDILHIFKVRIAMLYSLRFSKAPTFDVFLAALPRLGLAGEELSVSGAFFPVANVLGSQ